MKNRSQRMTFRKLRVRTKIYGTPVRPRLSVHRTLKHLYAQVIDDTQGKTLASVSSLTKGIKSNGNKEAAAKVGQLIAKKAIEKGVKSVVFDRSGLNYHGRVKAVAEGAREGGLKF